MCHIRPNVVGPLAWQVNVLLDLNAGTLAFSVRGKQLGAEMHGVSGLEERVAS
jgi:hypothetical protein